jgi:hypothetical protein
MFSARLSYGGGHSSHRRYQTSRVSGLAALFASFGGEAEAEGKGPERAARIRRIIGPFMLRRLKTDVLQALPPKSEEMRHLDLTPGQSELYSGCVRRIAANHGVWRAYLRDYMRWPLRDGLSEIISPRSRLA